MTTPPLLLLAALLFWGWQSDFLWVGAGLGVILETARFIKARWELSPVDFRRIWQFCTVLVLAVVVYAFAANDEDGGMAGLANASATTATRHIGVSATTFLRWLPMTLFMLIAAQVFSERGSVPLSSISIFFARRRRGLPEKDVNIAYPYFIACLFSSGIHTNKGGSSYFYGQAALLIWALWPSRSRRYGVASWLGMLVLVLALGFGAQRGLGEFQRMLNLYNARWLASFWVGNTDPTKSVTALGRVGQLKLSPQIMVRLETQPGQPPPEYLREACYRRYAKEVWTSGAGRNDFDNVQNDSATNQNSWTLSPGHTNGTKVRIACYLEGSSKDSVGSQGLLPLPIDTGHLENLRAYGISTNKLGAVLANGPGLVIFDANYGDGPDFTSPPDETTNRFDLGIPGNELSAVQQVAANLNVEGATDKAKLLAVQRFFATKFTYTTWLAAEKRSTTNETPLSRFLLKSHSGHCEYFATATVLLLRELGIPARYVVGYMIHEHSGNKYVARGRDAHAWCEVWNNSAKRWENFDTTPGSWVEIENGHASMLQWLTDFFSWIRFQFAKVTSSQENLRQYILWALVPVLVLLLYQIIFRRRKRGRKLEKNTVSVITDWPGLDSEFYQLERKLAKRGFPRERDEPLSHWINRILRDSSLADLQQPLKNIVRLHYGHRFDPRGLNAEERSQLAEEAKASLATLTGKEKSKR